MKSITAGGVSSTSPSWMPRNVFVVRSVSLAVTSLSVGLDMPMYNEQGISGNADEK